jgi:hypothetical protein
MKMTALQPVLGALAVLALVVACSNGGSPAWTYAPPTPGPTPGAPTGARSPGASSGMSAMPGMPSASPAGSTAPQGSEAAESPEASLAAESPEASRTAESPEASSTVESPEASDGNAPSGQVIELELTSSLQIHQGGQQVSSLAVKAGETIHFKITNTAGFQHDFYIGPPDQLGQNLVSGLPGVPSFDSGTQEFDYTVTADTANLQFGCSLTFHYPTMHGTFTVEP